MSFVSLQDRRYKNAKALCDVRQDCLSKFGVEQTACVRKCISSLCYSQIYEADPVRVNT